IVCSAAVVDAERVDKLPVGLDGLNCDIERRIRRGKRRVGYRCYRARSRTAGLNLENVEILVVGRRAGGYTLAADPDQEVSARLALHGPHVIGGSLGRKEWAARHRRESSSLLPVPMLYPATLVPWWSAVRDVTYKYFPRPSVVMFPGWNVPVENGGFGASVSTPGVEPLASPIS